MDDSKEIKSGAHMRLVLKNKLGNMKHELLTKMTGTVASRLKHTTLKDPIVPRPSTTQGVVILQSNEQQIERDGKALKDTVEALVDKIKSSDGDAGKLMKGLN